MTGVTDKDIHFYHDGQTLKVDCVLDDNTVSLLSLYHGSKRECFCF